jgi:hypothetical protein
MELLILQLFVIAGLWWLWARRARVQTRTPPAATSEERPQIDLRRPAPRRANETAATIHVVFAESDEQSLLLDCVLAERYGAVPAGQAFTMVVRLPLAIGSAMTALFQRWSQEGRPVQLRVELDQHGPRARFVVDDTQARLEILASSPLRGADGRS